MDYNKVVLVDKEDNEIGLEEKISAHLKGGKTHRAFSVFIFNSKGELLLQQRAKGKMLWPLYWSNSCCSHPAEGESYEAAAKRRSMEELGIDCEPEFVFKFLYSADYKDIGSENELCAVLLAKSDMEPEVEPSEIENIRYIKIEDLKKEIEEKRETFSPWFLIEFERLLKEYDKMLKKFCGNN